MACVPRHTIRMKDRVRPDKLREAVEQALLRFPHMMLSVERTETGFRYRTNVRPAVVLPFDGVSTRYTIGSADTNGYLFLVGYHEDTIYMEYQHSISDGRGFEEFIRCVLFQYLKNCGCPVENPECRFLQDAVEAKKKLPAAETELETYRQQAKERAEQLDAEYQAAKKKATDLNCRKDLQAQRFLVADLRKASERFAKLTAQKERLAEVKERIKAIDEELSKR